MINVPPNITVPSIAHPFIIQDVLNIGVGANGTVNQTASFVFVDNINMGVAGGLTGTYNLSGGNIRNQAGALPGPTEVIGVSGSGFFTQSGGDHAVNSFILGQNFGSFGSYNLTGGALNALNEIVGNSGIGIFNQTGGTNTVNAEPLTLGQNAGSNGTYILTGAGKLPTPPRHFRIVGVSGIGLFDQTGGTKSLPAALTLGSLNVGSNGTYNLTAGTLTLGAGTDLLSSATPAPAPSTRPDGIPHCNLRHLPGLYRHRPRGLYLERRRPEGATAEVIGEGGTGTFTQIGGSNSLSGNLTLGNYTGTRHL